jgi:phosphoribosylformimino-5-aminoimidazole carboxamide ribonucleotide (ProFAR) isomerase
VAQRAWVPIYKITLTHPQKMYKKKVKETATIFTAIQRDGNTAGVFPRPLSKLVRKT